MIVRGKLRPHRLLRTSWKKLVLMTVYSSAFVVAYEHGHVEVSIPPTLPTMLGTALSVMLAFKTNAAYDRWWEARKIWGGIVNDSRTFARQVLTLIVAPAEDQQEARKLQEELVQRQIGWSLSLNRSLRGSPALPELEPFVSGAELDALESQANVPNALLQTQAQRIQDARALGFLDRLLSLPIEDTLARFTDHMGKCERTKSTKFSTPYAYIVSRAIWLFFLMMPAGLVQHLGWITVPVSILVVGFFVLIELVSTYLQDPFENRSTDTPMDAICRTIEINLRQQLGETELPSKLEPVDGVLM